MLTEGLRSAGFPVIVSTDPEDWLTAHAAFIVPIATVLLRVGVQPRRLAADQELLTTMVRDTRQAFRALEAAGNSQIPRNLRALYLLMPQRFAVRYWQRVLAGPRGELWFAAHTCAAPEEMASLGQRAACRNRHRRRTSPGSGGTAGGGSQRCGFKEKRWKPPSG